MESLQGTKSSSEGDVFYESLGSLLKDYRKWLKLPQEKLADLIKVSVRELRNWEAGNRRAGIDNLHDISEITGIPMQVCLALNANQPIWYSLRKRMFMYSSVEETMFSSRDLFGRIEKPQRSIHLKKLSLKKDKYIDMITSCHKDCYNSGGGSLRQDVIEAAASIVPDKTYILLDYWNHYVAHKVCLPMTIDTYQELKKQKSVENYLTSEMIEDIASREEGVFFYYSTFAINASILSWMAIDGWQNLSKIKRKERYLVVCHAYTKGGEIIQRNLGMRLAKNCAYTSKDLLTYEGKLDLIFPKKENKRLLQLYDA